MSLNRYRKSLKKLWRRLQRRVLSGRRILVLGDSHGGVFEYCFDQGMLVPHWLNCDIVGGATAYGLNNDHSITQARQKFDHSLRRFANYDVVVVTLGECDCGFALWKKARQLNVSPQSLIDHSLAGIRRLVLGIQNAPASNIGKIVLVGAILPTVDDLAAPTQDNELRREIDASQAARTALVLAFNDGLKHLAETLAVPYFDLTRDTMNTETGLVDPRFVGRAGDHHLSFPASAQLWCSALLRCL